MIRIAHVEDPLPRRSSRFLIERTWPKHVDRETLQLDGWFKEAAPSYDLQRWYGGRLERWMEYREEYLEQLRDRSESLRKLREAMGLGDIVLLHADPDRDLNHAAVLKEFLEAD
jgi:uncharacterized protein YeaO (DUF488 family)